jgi:sugar phosphate isomerase/epimerase
MWDIGFMAWRIGEILDLDAQIDWIRDSGFDAVSFHASSGFPGRWRGVDPSSTTPAERRLLRDKLSGFTICEVHAPFNCELIPDKLPFVLDQLAPIIRFAGEIGASILTIHGDPPSTEGDIESWQRALDRLDAMANESGVILGLELMSGFERLNAQRRANIGVTLDVGHMYLNEGAGYRPYGTIGGLVRALGEMIVHLHVHDYDGVHDHVEVGTGRVDFDDLLSGLASVGYKGALCLELNPDLVSPEGIRRSMGWLRCRMENLMRRSSS